MADNDLRRCARCQQHLPLDSFGVKIRKTGQLQSYCKDCTKSNSKAHYDANKKRYAERNRKGLQAVGEFLRETKESTPCTDCGGNYPYYVMHFDHLPQYTKSSGISRMRSGASSASDIAKIKDEIAKCEVVCANCHAERTQKRLMPS